MLKTKLVIESTRDIWDKLQQAILKDSTYINRFVKPDLSGKIPKIVFESFGFSDGNCETEHLIQYTSVKNKLKSTKTIFAAREYGVEDINGIISHFNDAKIIIGISWSNEFEKSEYFQWTKEAISNLKSNNL